MHSPRRALGTFILVTAIVTSSCSGSSTHDQTAPSSTSVVSTTTTTSTPPTTTVPKASRGASSSSQAAAELVSAWENHDRNAAHQIADAAAVDGIFATPDSSMWVRGCTTDDSLPKGGCVYRSSSGLIQINTEHRAIGWVVSTAVYDAFTDGGLPADPGDAPATPPPTTAAAVTTMRPG